MIIGLHPLNDVSHYKLYNTQSAGTSVMASVCGLMFLCSSRFAQVVFNNVQLAFVQDALVVLVADV